MKKSFSVKVCGMKNSVHTYFLKFCGNLMKRARRLFEERSGKTLSMEKIWEALERLAVFAEILLE